MLIKLRIPKTLLWVVNLFAIYLLIFTLFRLATYFAFRPENEEFTSLFPTFILGLRFDLRWISLILMPIVVFSFYPRLSPFYSRKNRKFWSWYLAIITFFVFFFFAADFGSFTYNQTRLDAGALNFVEDAAISMTMLWESYPMVWLLLGLVTVVLFFRWLFQRTHGMVVNRTDGRGIPYKRKWFVVTAVLFGAMIYGNAGASPLYWKKAFGLHDSFSSYLALNPLQHFFTTLRFRKPQYNEANARAAFPVVNRWLELNEPNSFNYRREILPTVVRETKPNIVLVLCESFSMYKSSMSGNPLGTTPYFNQLADDGIFFERCFTPHFSTARGLFATLTGIPDVQSYKFSTQNEAALQQHTIIDNFEGYEKLYFLGGSPEFNNFQGLLENIDGLQMFTEGSFSSRKMNVWGISDKNLFLEANQVFKKKENPFFAIVQTAGNHRPFMIPEEDRDFVPANVDDDTLTKYGFGSLDEYNAFRYSDYCVRKFMEQASKEAYFQNTIFVFVGDHGVAGNARAVYPRVWTTQRLTDEHVPLLFYAPGMIEPERRKEPVSQIDVLPTIAGLAGQRYVNTTLGRDLLQPDKKNDFAFIIYPGYRIGIVTDEYYYTRSINSGAETLDPVQSDLLPHTPDDQKKIMKEMSKLSISFYETARWMLMNNKPVK